MKNRTITGHWDGEPISRPKTLGERHPDMFKPKHQALVSKEEIMAKFKANQIKKAGGESNFKRKIHEQKSAIHKALSHQKEPSSKEKSDYQRRTGRAYSE